MAIASGEIKNETVTTILAATTANTAGDWHHYRARQGVFEVVITGTKNVDIEGSFDGVTAMPIPIQNDITSSVAFTFTDTIPYIRANPTSGSGTATVRIAT